MSVLSLGPENVCRCARPKNTGRKYFGHNACRLCDRLIVARHDRELVDRLAHQRTQEHLLRTRSRALGGLEP